MQVEELDIPGCYLIKAKVFHDNRGSFVKTFQASIFNELGLETQFNEEYFSISKKDVIRGMHFQRPPVDQAKLVYCLKGGVLDAFVDIRAGSPSFQEHQVIDLNSENHHILYLPSGIAHGFCALKSDSIMVYKTTTEYAPDYDDGIRWDSCNINWPTVSPVISGRDIALETLLEFKTPFHF